MIRFYLVISHSLTNILSTALKEFPYLFVQFYANDCKYCHDLAPTWEALGEVVTDTSMNIVDEHMSENDVGSDEYTDEEYETAVNNMAPVLVTKLNCSLNPSICNGQGIRVYPTMRVFVDGEAKGDFNGHRTVMELVQWLSHIEADSREPGELKMKKVVECTCGLCFNSLYSTRTHLFSPDVPLCYIVVDANERTVRNAAEKEWNDALTRYRSPYGSWNATRSQGCQLTGHIVVDKAPGKFLIHAQSYGHDIAANMANLSHIVHHFSFGDEDAQSHVDGQRLQGMQSGFAKSLHPMDGNVYVTEELHQAYHHHLRVIATEFFEGKAVMWAREQYRRFYRILQNSQLSTYRRHILPGENTLHVPTAYALFLNLGTHFI
jgi:thiol-disulfide isomerase/thioredoxin